jgi:hypothetical protein
LDGRTRIPTEFLGPTIAQTPDCAACGRAAGGYGESVRVGLTLAVIGAAIGIGGIIYGVLWLLAALE